MGAGIAQVSVDNGKYRVLLKDKDQAGVNRGEKTVDDALKGQLKKKKKTDFEYSETMSRLVPLHDGVDLWKRHLGNADLVIEAVFEEISVKHRVLKEMEAVLPKHAIFASNTSAIPIGQIAQASSRPENVIGMHYFSPVPMMPLLEIIPHAGTAPEVVNCTCFCSVVDNAIRSFGHSVIRPLKAFLFTFCLKLVYNFIPINIIVFVSFLLLDNYCIVWYCIVWCCVVYVCRSLLLLLKSDLAKAKPLSS